jgi:hypothetical protein
MVGIVEVEIGQAVDLGGARGHLHDRRLALEIRPFGLGVRSEGVQAGGEAHYFTDYNLFVKHKVRCDATNPFRSANPVNRERSGAAPHDIRERGGRMNGCARLSVLWITYDVGARST